MESNIPSNHPFIFFDMALHGQVKIQGGGE